MKTFFDAGYLSDKTPEHIQYFNIRFARLRRFYEEVNAYGCDLRKRFSAPKGVKPIRAAFAILLFNRMLDAYQCVLILLERGAGDEAKGLLRAMLECLFLIGANDAKKRFAARYIQEDLRQVRKLNERGLEASRVAIRLRKEQFLTKEKRKEMRLTIERLRKEISKHDKRRKRRSFGPFENAKAAGKRMLFEYNKSYAYLCLHTHTSPSGNLEKYLRRDLAPSAINYVVGPHFEHTEVTLLLAIEYLLIALFYLNRLFCLGEKVVLEKYCETRAEMDVIAAKMPPVDFDYQQLPPKP